MRHLDNIRINHECKFSTNAIDLCDYAHMDWSNLEYFLAVAKEGS